MGPPEADWAEVSRQEFDMTKNMTIQQLLGYLHTWSSYNTFKRQHPTAPDPVDAFAKNVLEAFATNDVHHTIAISFPIFLLLAKKPA